MAMKIQNKQIQPKSMRSSCYDQRSCQFCYQTTHQHRIFLFSIRKQLKRLIQNPLFQPEEEHLYEPEREGLARIVELTSANKMLPKPNYRPCLHMKWLRLLKRQLDVNLDTIDQLCHSMANKIAERNFHLYLLQTQTKNAAQTVQALLRENRLSDVSGVVHYEAQECENWHRVKNSKPQEAPFPTNMSINATDPNRQCQEDSRQRSRISQELDLNCSSLSKKRP